mmetsp:Transcript_3320/g.13946  ORF Transcript_3320/g.13946 Transcript_3320/m.13946 type:complete len:208 (-) Transcript_3320:335-958(-)
MSPRGRPRAGWSSSRAFFGDRRSPPSGSTRIARRRNPRRGAEDRFVSPAKRRERLVVLFPVPARRTRLLRARASRTRRRRARRSPCPSPCLARRRASPAGRRGRRATRRDRSLRARRRRKGRPRTGPDPRTPRGTPRTGRGGARTRPRTRTRRRKESRRASLWRQTERQRGNPRASPRCFGAPGNPRCRTPRACARRSAPRTPRPPS